jgi:hypothetical protein
MAQRTLAASLRIERADPGERHARRDRRSPSIDRRAGPISTNAISRRQHDGGRRAPERIRSGRGSAGFGWGGARILPRVREGSVCEDRPDDRGIVQRGNQP